MKLPPLFPDLSTRATQAEYMDDPDCNLDRLHRTLDQFALINRLFTRVRHLLDIHVVRSMQRDPGRVYHLVDLGAGACDVPAWLLRHCAARGLRLRISACDHDPRVVAFARRRHGHLAGLDILCRDATDLGDLAPIDFIFASHLLHHLPDRAVVDLLRTLPRTGAHVVLLNDIERRRSAYVSFYAAARFLFRGSYAFEDGLLSIRKSFRPHELQALLAGGSVPPYQIDRVFPARIVLRRQHDTHGSLSRPSRCRE